MLFARHHSPIGRIRAAGLFAVIASSSLLIGCQGFSAGSSSAQQQQQQQTGGFSLGASTLDFGSVTAGTSKSMSVTATNSEAQAVTVSSVALSSKYFSLTAPTLPVTIAAGQSTTFTVQFSPNAPGTFTGTASLSSDASNSTSTLSLTGTGVSQGQLIVSPTSQDFGSVLVGSAQAVTVTLTNNGASTANVSQVAVSGIGFQINGITAPLSLDPSQSTTFTVTFGPEAAGSATGSVTISSDASNPTLTMDLSGIGITPGALGSNPTSFGFGSVTVGNKQTLSGTLTNTGGSSATISQAGITGTGFSLSGITAPLTLAAGQSVSFSVSFAPQSTGNSSGAVTFTSTASNPTLSIPLSGSGTAAVGQLTISPSTLSLGSVVVGTSKSGSGTLTASGASVTVTSASTNNSVFSIGGLTLPMTIPAGQSVPFTVTFSPLATGAATATLTVGSNAQSSTTTETLTGTGTAAPKHSVNLSWNASTSSNISGYNVYRAPYGSSCGSYAKINAALNTSTLYTDPTVTNGSAYCYATTAVNSSNEESSYSNIVSNVLIPAQ